jgi:2-dehydro-3-deoxygluconokinase
LSGEAALDLVAIGEPLVEFAAEQQGPLGSITTFRRGFGGDTSNVAIAAARLGASSGYVTRLGADDFGRAFLRLWRAEGVDVAGVSVDPDALTGIYFIARREDGGHEFTYYRRGSAASRLTPGDVDADYLASARFVHTSGISQAISGSARDTVRRTMGLARDRGIGVSYDGNVRPKLAPPGVLREDFELAARMADVLFVSAEDLAHLGWKEPDAALETLHELGPDLVVLKRGAQGCAVSSRTSEGGEVEPLVVEAVDGSGAGDAFAAAFLCELVRGANPVEAARLANAVGAITAAGLGAVSPLPTREEAERFLAGERLERLRTASDRA